MFLANIDQQIADLHDYLQILEPIIETDAESWQQAWDRHPELRNQERELFLLRAEELS